MTNLSERIAKLTNEQLEFLRQSLKTDRPLAKKDEIDWETEAALDLSIYPKDTKANLGINPQAVLVTGATGFLGTFLVHELAQQTRAKIYCLVRAANTLKALNKLNKNWIKYGFTGLQSNSRIIPVLGDLEKPCLGIQEDLLTQLSEEVDVIYHNGTFVNFVYPYKTLKPANVLGTKEVLRFACTRKTKPVHYVSTISVFGDRSNLSREIVMENEIPPKISCDMGGYAQSKWVAECLVRTAGSRGLPICIYRPSFITGDSSTGIWNSDDFLSRIISACMLLGKAPEEEIFLDTVPVDYVGRALVYLSGQLESYGKTFHLTNPALLSSRNLIDWVKKSGYPIETISFDLWLNALRAEVGHSINHPFFLLIAIFEQEKKSSDNLTSAMRFFDCRHVLEGLAKSDIQCPDPNEELWHNYFSCFNLVREGQ